MIPEARPTYERFMAEFERFAASQDPERDIRPLGRAAAAHMKLGRRVALAELGPCLAVIWFRTFDYEAGWKARAVVRLLRWFFEKLVYRGRPLWNDFHMALWLLSRDPFYVQGLHSHLARARRRGLLAQYQTGTWMVTSVCRQDEEFRGVWEFMTRRYGDIFGPELHA